MSDNFSNSTVSRRTVLAAAAVAPAMAVVAAGSVRAQQVKSADRVAIVTGSSRGIGAATARRLAADGFRVVVNCRVNRELAAGVVRDIKASGGEAVWEQADIRDPAAVRRLFDVAERNFGGIDVAVANAGVMHLATFAEMTDEDYDTMMDTNVKGSFNTMREASRRLRDGGRIIATSSSIVQLRTPTYGPYAASKGSMELFANILAKELAGRNISVNAIAPGVVATPLFLDGKTAEQVAGFAARTPHGRIGEPADIAGTVAMLCSDDGWWVNGQTVYTNGGIV